MAWYRVVLHKLEISGLFREVNLVGAKIRAIVDVVQFLDIYFAPVSESYSYAFIDLRLPYPGDKRLFGGDDYPHEGVTEIEQLEGYPHHFHRRDEDGDWIFESSPMRGDIVNEIDTVTVVVQEYLQRPDFDLRLSDV
ncbi:MAG: hypothetical protein GVY30_00885 [Chloroflexi bacterium]|jgi:hypothetical protein|nr:hypothetical protein [Chloroflexota bacterium]